MSFKKFSTAQSAAAKPKPAAGPATVLPPAQKPAPAAPPAKS